MGKYRNEFGSILNVDDELAARIGSKWKPYDGEPDEQPTAERQTIEVPEGDPDESWSLQELKALAAEEGVDIKGLRTKGAILEAFDAVAAGDEPDEVPAADGAPAVAPVPAPVEVVAPPAPGEVVEVVEDVIELPEGDPDDTWSLQELKALAADEGIDIKGLRSKADIIAAINAVEPGDEPADEAPAGDGAED